MQPTILGIHHVTAITGDAQRNIDFYCGVLGLRLVKVTVNFDDPGSYHLYYGDGLGRPGTLLTFFAWPGAQRGRVGPPQVTAVALAVPPQAMEYWQSRLGACGAAPADRFGQRAIRLADPDGMAIEIVADDVEAPEAWAGGGVPPEHAVRAIQGVTVCEEDPGSDRLLADLLGLVPSGDEGGRVRYRAGAVGRGQSVDLLRGRPMSRRGSLGAGIVHHLALRTPDDAQQAAWRRKLAHAEINVSPVMDRKYFHSIYFRQPNGVLYEIATDGPGFTVDEPAERLGTGLALPAEYEPRRREIEELLPKVRIPGGGALPGR